MASTETLIEPSSVTPRIDQYPQVVPEAGHGRRAEGGQRPLRRDGFTQVGGPPDPRPQRGEQPEAGHRVALRDRLVDERDDGVGQRAGHGGGDRVAQVVEQRRVEPQHEPGGAERHHEQRHGGQHAEERHRGGEVVAPLLEVPLAGAGEMVQPLVPRTQPRRRGPHRLRRCHARRRRGERPRVTCLESRPRHRRAAVQPQPGPGPGPCPVRGRDMLAVMAALPRRSRALPRGRPTGCAR